MQKFFDFAFAPCMYGTENLYFRSKDFKYSDGILISKHKKSEISFDTYFNLISSVKIKKYTDIEKLRYEINAEGSFIASIVSFDGKECTIVSEDGTIKVSDIPNNSVYVFLKIKTISNSCSIKKISVFATSKNLQYIKTAIIFCTYKREAYIVNNANYLSERLSSNLDVNAKILVVDNGKTLSSDDFSSEKIFLFPNENTGGSGGFERGMREAAKMSEFTHFVLIDDDVKIDFISLQKMLGFLKFTKSEYKDLSISGAMLYMDNPIVQFECGGYFGKNGIQKGYGHFLDMTLESNLATNELLNEINYGGWWFICIPMKYVNDGNYPLPFFIKFDDVEYCLRCKLDIITLNGVSVWHERFENKYNSYSDYYNTRNYLHLSKMYVTDFSNEQARKIMRTYSLDRIQKGQYNMAKSVVKGFHDYHKGIDYLYEVDRGKKNLEVCRLNYKLLTSSELRNKYSVNFSNSKNRFVNFVMKRIRTFIYQHCRKGKIIINDVSWQNSIYDSKASVIIFYNYDTKKGYVVKDNNINKRGLV